jgi:hypothetical protein
MSLSEFIGLPDVKAKFREEFVKPAFRVKKAMLAPVETSNPQMIGTAFDYLLRFYASYINPNVKSRHWVAESSLEILNSCRNIDEVIITPNNRLAKARNIDRIHKKYLKKCKELKNRAYSEYKDALDLANINYESYLKTGDMSDDLICSSLALAKMDVLKRADYLLPLESSPSEKKDMKDLRQLISIINPETIQAHHTCVLNPVFGPEASDLMRADGDIVIDDTLIDVKTVKDLKVDRKIFNQLLGYYTLYRIGGIRGMPSSNQINKLGIYFSRHGYLHTYQIDDIVNESTYLDFIRWFKKRALEFGLP